MGAGKPTGPAATGSQIKTASCTRLAQGRVAQGTGRRFRIRLNTAADAGNSEKHSPQSRRCRRNRRAGGFCFPVGLGFHRREIGAALCRTADLSDRADECGRAGARRDHPCDAAGVAVADRYRPQRGHGPAGARLLSRRRVRGDGPQAARGLRGAGGEPAADPDLDARQSAARREGRAAPMARSRRSAWSASISWCRAAPKATRR